MYNTIKSVFIFFVFINNINQLQTFNMEPQNQASFLEPKHFIKEKSDLSDYQCTICYELPARPVRCSNCRKSFCMRCVSDQKKIQDVCPFRCSDHFSIEVVKNIPIEFRCPYSEDCLEPIHSIRQFYEHDLICSKISETDKKFKVYLRQYLCLRGQHTLEFFVGTYDEMCNELECSNCKKKKLCRSICRPCNERFCIQCRPVPASKKQCPVGHKMEKSELSNMNYICDICGLPSILTGKHTYDDHFCNFGICELCFEELPEQRPPIVCIQNNPSYCLKQIQNQDKELHKLVVDKGIKIQTKCQICKQVRKHMRKCPTCQTHYCFKCKTFLVQADETCPEEHEFQLKHSPKPVKCDRCLHDVHKIYQDFGCEVSLCQTCLKYGKVMKSDSERYLKPFFCDKGHLLMLHTAKQNFSYLCSKCEVYNEIKFFCINCGNNKLFCCRCYPPPNPDLCYLGHPLKPLQTEMIVCHMCSGKGHSDAKGVTCTKCNFCVCRKCHKKAKSKMEQEN